MATNDTCDFQYSKAIYKILRTIDIWYENDIPIQEMKFDLNKIGVSQRRLALILRGLNNAGYIEGINFSKALTDKFSPQSPRLTILGMTYLETNSTMKQAYKALKEVRDWLPF